MGIRSWKFAALTAAVCVGVFAALLSASPTGREADMQDLASSDKARRSAAVDRLAAGNAGVIGELIESLSDPHTPIVRAGLVQAIRKAGGPSSGHATSVKALLASRDLKVRLAAVQTLQDSPSVARTELTNLLNDVEEDSAVRAAAATALGAAGAQSRSSLRRMAADIEAPVRVRLATMRALAKCGPQGITDVEAIATDATRATPERHVAIRAISEAGSSGHGALTRLSLHATPFVRAHATAGIARVGTAADAPTLLRLLADAVADVRIEALRALQKLDLEVANTAAVAACLADADVRLQSLACQILRRTKASPFAAVQVPLRGLVASATFRIRHDAALALFAYGDNFGAAQMAIDKGAGTLSQRRMAGRAHDLITGKGK